MDTDLANCDTIGNEEDDLLALLCLEVFWIEGVVEVTTVEVVEPLFKNLTK